MPLTYLKPPTRQSLAATDELRERVSGIIREIELGGLAAVRKWSRDLDGWDPESFIVPREEIARAESALEPELRTHIAFAQDQIRTFARAQRESLHDVEIEPVPGVVLGHRHIPIDVVGAYVPGGRYPMLASSFMTILVAKEAGVGKVIGCAPPQPEGGIHPAMLYAMHSSGADTIVCLGGIQALAAMTFGLLPDLPAVDMLVGAGNAFVAEAKRQLFGHAGIDLLAGPTEVLVIADSSADPHLVAADLLGQAEHGPNSPAGVIAIGDEVGHAVIAEVESLLETWPTADVAGAAWREFGWVAVVDNDDEALEAANEAANEHVEVHVEESKLDEYRLGLRNYGSLFLGDQATVAYGDKGVGTNHVLPTARAARYTGGLWVGKFLKTCTYQRLTDEGTRIVAPAIEAISNAERMRGHALTARMRLDRLTAPSA